MLDSSEFNLQRQQFLELVELLGDCGEPYSITAALMSEVLEIVDEICHEMGMLVDDIVSLAREKSIRLPETEVAAIRQDLANMGRLRQRYRLALLFSSETQERCGHQAVPVLALTLFQVWNWVEYGAEWLESVDRLRIQVDARLSDRLRSHSRVDRSDGRSKSEGTV